MDLKQGSPEISQSNAPLFLLTHCSITSPSVCLLYPSIFTSSLFSLSLTSLHSLYCIHLWRESAGGPHLSQEYTASTEERTDRGHPVSPHTHMQTYTHTQGLFVDTASEVHALALITGMREGSPCWRTEKTPSQRETLSWVTSQTFPLHWLWNTHTLAPVGQHFQSRGK